MAESDGVGAHAEGRAPFFGDGFGQADDAGFGQRVVCLAGVAVQAGGRGDVDDVAGGAVFDAEVGGCGADEFEGLGVVQGEDGVPLFVCCLWGVVVSFWVLEGRVFCWVFGWLAGWKVLVGMMGSLLSRTYLVNHAVPGVASVVNNDVNLPATKLSSLLDERIDVFVVEHVSGNREGLATILVDGIRNAFRLFCGCCCQL